MTAPGDETDEDRQWRSIVENYGERPELEERASLPERDASVPERDASTSERDAPAPERDASAHFVPPVPPPAPAPEPAQLLAWAGVLGVPTALIVLVVFQVVLPSWGSLLMLVWFLGGFGYLVATMRRDPGPDDPDDWDDGAVV